MATAKKSTTAKKPVAKKAAPKRAAAKTTQVKTKVTQVKRAVVPVGEVKSFRRSKPAQPFFTVQPTKQTVYWLILAGIVLALGVWVADLSSQVQELYDQIDATNRETDSLVIPVKKD